MSTAKKKNRKPCWTIMETGLYLLQDGNDSAFANGSYTEGATFSTFISNNVFYGEIVAKKIRNEKVSEVLNDMIEIHPLTMETCGLKIGGPVVISSSSSAFVGRVWPSYQLRLNCVALPASNLSFDGFKIGCSVFVVSPMSIFTAEAIILNPVFNLKNDSEMQSLIKTTHFLKYVTHYVDKTYVVQDQDFQMRYFGTLLNFRVEKVIDGAKNEEGFFMENSFASDPNGSLSENVGLLQLNSNKSKSFTSSTPMKRISDFKSKSELNGSAQFVEEHCYFQSCDKVFMLTSKTDIKFQVLSTDRATKIPNVPLITFEDVGGLKEQKESLKDLMIAPVKNPKKFKQIGIKPLHGIILYGASGTGKSLLAKAAANELGGTVKTIVGSQVTSKFFGESETKLRAIFTEAISQAPCVIVIDDVDSLCPRRDATRTDAEKRLVAAFIAVLDELNTNEQDSNVIVIGTTNRIEAIDPALRRSGRFDREIEITIPTSTERVEIFQKLLSKVAHKVTDADLQVFAEKCHGYVGADLSAVCKEAASHAIKNSSDHENESVFISLNDLDHGLKLIPPSAMRELIVDIPKVFWKDIGGNAAVKQKLKHTVEWPLKNPEAFSRVGIDPPRGILLYGPPGCSKTLTAKALATESGLNFISIKGPELFDKFVGDSEKAIRKIFAKARSAAPAIVFIDELDALATKRGGENNVGDRVLTTLLTEMDGVEHRNDVIVVAATNRPDVIDKAFLRPGRIDRILHVPLPSPDTRKEIFEINFRKMPIDSDVDIANLVEQTHLFSGAEICALCREAGLAALENDINALTVTSKDFAFALKSVIPQTSEEMMKFYENYEQTLQ